MTKILNLGCGTDIMEDCINLDIQDNDGVDVIHNIDVFPYPFKDNTFDEVICNNVLEYSKDLVKTMEELHRITKNGGIIRIKDVAYSNIGQYTQPESIRVFSIDSFQWLDANNESYNRMVRTEKRFVITAKGYIKSKYFRWLPQGICNLLSWFINSVNSRVYFRIVVEKDMSYCRNCRRWFYGERCPNES